MRKDWMEGWTPLGQESLRDESFFVGDAETISYPEQVQELAATLAFCNARGIPLTLQGACTGLCGAGVPQGGHVANLSRMKRVLAHSECRETLSNGMTALGTIQVQPGITLEELDKEIQKAFQGEALCFPVQPTEKTASLGGVLSVGAKGPRSYYYGNAAPYVKSLEFCLPTGELFTCEADSPLFDAALEGEGMFGAIGVATLSLVRQPECCWGIVFFFPGDAEAMAFAAEADGLARSAVQGSAQLLSIEYIDRHSIRLLERYKSSMDSLAGLPDIPPESEALIYLEIGAEEEEPILELAETLLGLSAGQGADPDVSWAMSGQQEVQLLQQFRHALSECVNMTVAQNQQGHPGLTLLASDLSLPGQDRLALLKNYQKTLGGEGLPHCIFGHIGLGHLYVNILCENEVQYTAAQELLTKWMQQAAASGGSLYTDYGLGKTKRAVLAAAAPLAEKERIAEKKARLDPQNIMNPGNGIPLPGEAGCQEG